MALASRVEGAAGELVIDTHSLAISFQETVAAQDSLLVVGGTDNPVAAALVSSTDNRFTEVIDGVTLTVNESSTEDVTVTVKQTEEPVVTQITQFVEQYNKLQDKLEELTAYDETTNTGAVLFGSNVALRLQSDFGRLLTSRFFGLGSIQSLEEVGLSVDAKGRLQFSTDLNSAVKGADAVFIAVGTPTRRGDGHADLTYVYAAAAEIAKAVDGDTVVVTKSTVPVGTGRKVAESCAPLFKKVSLELGGKNPNIIFADADLPAAIAGSPSVWPG